MTEYYVTRARGVRSGVEEVSTSETGEGVTVRGFPEKDNVRLCKAINEENRVPVMEGSWEVVYISGQPRKHPTTPHLDLVVGALVEYIPPSTSVLMAHVTCSHFAGLGPSSGGGPS
ncbi:hypothetical protein RRG08_020215 [Elysia crispata]|uniref:Uncharacterized protein n=1 Tax=Elysia crispata TaxID=231223 RepID=A0AAE1A2B8_9GAST|nr:hypothetical protein RRG08_020215 [Elysia crispata]